MNDAPFENLGKLLGGLDLFGLKLQDISVIGSDCQVQLEIFFTSVHLKIAGLSGITIIAGVRSES